MVTVEEIRKMVEEEYVKSVMSMSEMDAYIMTSGIPKEGLRLLLAHTSLIMVWIRQVLDGNSNKVTDENKVRIINEILNVDKIYTDEAVEEK